MTYSIKELIERNISGETGGNGQPDPTKYTCYSCLHWKKCPFAFDAYNISGDCIAEK